MKFRQVSWHIPSRLGPSEKCRHLQNVVAPAPHDPYPPYKEIREYNALCEKRESLLMDEDDKKKYLQYRTYFNLD